MLKDIHSLILYHVTPSENVQSILQNGIDPAYATGKMKASWYVSRHRIEWAIIHAANLHHCTPDEMHVCAVHVLGSTMYRFNRAGFYYTYTIQQIESATPVMFFLHECGLGEIENE